MKPRYIFMSLRDPGPEIYIKGWAILAPQMLNSAASDQVLAQGFEETGYIHVFQLVETSTKYRRLYSKCFGL